MRYFAPSRLYRSLESAEAGMPARNQGAIVFLIACLAAVGSSGCGGGSDGNGAGEVLAPAPPLSLGPAACVGGLADGIPCLGISLGKRVPLEDMGGSFGNDLWGWVDAQTGREYALMGMDTGTAFVDVSDPRAPVFLGRLPTQTSPSIWRDIKVYRDHAYVVADDAGNHGMQVFDLTRLRGIQAPQIFAADVVFTGTDSAHNLAIDEETGFAFIIGEQLATGSCPAMRIVDITVPQNPIEAACYRPVFDSHFVHGHDAQCVIYRGPDPDHSGQEICISANGDHVEIVDVTQKQSPARVAAFVYDELVPVWPNEDGGFAHQGWLTDDQRFFLLGDESDEAHLGYRTSTYIFDLEDLDSPLYVGRFEAGTSSSDHNLYIRGDLVYQANYEAGLRVLQIGDLSNVELTEVAFFDTALNHDHPYFAGAWSVYPWLPSGTLLVSDTDQGLLVLIPD